MTYLITANFLIIINQQSRINYNNSNYTDMGPFKVRDRQLGRTISLTKQEYELLTTLLQAHTLEELLDNNNLDRPSLMKSIDILKSTNLIKEVDVSNYKSNSQIIIADNDDSMDGIEIAPNTIIWGSTNRCNLSCRHCINNNVSNTYYSGELDMTNLTKLFEEMDSLGVENFEISGGEPLIRDDMEKILYKTIDKSFTVGIFTNALLIDETMICLFKQILEKKPWGIALHISLDGGSSSSHDFIRRQKGSFEKTLKILEQLNNKSVPIEAIETMATSLNIDEIDEIVKICIRFNVKNLNIHPIYNLNDEVLFKDLDLDFKDRLKYFDKVAEAINKYNNCINIIYSDPYFPIEVFNQGKNKDVAKKIFSQIINSNFIKTDNFQSYNMKFKVKRLRNCSSGINKLYIAPNGDSYPCLLYNGSNIDFCGNIKDTSLLDIWKSKGMRRSRKPITKELLHFCNKCPHFDICNNKIKRCRIASEISLGDFWGPSKLCLKYADELGIPAELVKKYKETFNWENISYIENIKK